MFARGHFGITDASATKRLSKPRTRRCWSTTPIGSLAGAIFAVQLGWKPLDATCLHHDASCSSSAMVAADGARTPSAIAANSSCEPTSSPMRTPSTSRRTSSSCWQKPCSMRGCTCGSADVSVRRPPGDFCRSITEPIENTSVPSRVGICDTGISCMSFRSPPMPDV